MSRTFAAPRRAFTFAASLLLFSAACAQNQKLTTAANSNSIVVSSTPPFETQEPESYRATRTITTITANGQTSVTKYVIAKDGESRRDESENGGQHVVYLTLAEGRLVLLPDEKIFAAIGHSDVQTNENEPATAPDRLLHTELVTPSYQKLGSETINGRNLQKYRVVVNNSLGENVSVGETLLWFDESLRMPVRTEISSPEGTRITTELSDIVLKVDEDLFAVPKDYQKVEFNKLRERLKYDQP